MLRIYIRNKYFLKNFIFLLMIFLSAGMICILMIYYSFAKRLEDEIENICMKQNKEYLSKMEDTLKQTQLLASKLTVDDRIQMFFTFDKPELLIDHYYSEISAKIQIHSLQYVDSIVLYAPKFRRMFTEGMVYPNKIDENKETDDRYIRSTTQWLDKAFDNLKSNARYSLRDIEGRWPYYLTVFKYYNKGSVEGVVLININLTRLYEHLSKELDDKTSIYFIDQQNNVIIKKNKNELNTNINSISELDNYIPNKTLGFIEFKNKTGYIYTQTYSQSSFTTCVVITELQDYIVTMNNLKENFILVSLIILAFVILLTYFFSIKLVNPIMRLNNLFYRIENNQKYVLNHKEDISEVANKIISYIQTNMELKQELDKRLDLLNKTHMIALQSQINPHFLFNTLNTISLMIESKCGNDFPAVTMIEELSNILRYSLEEGQSTTIGEELKYVQRYIKIMQYRYEYFTYIIDKEDNVDNFIMPRLILQPIVENSIKHGFSMCNENRQGELHIVIKSINYKYPGNETPIPSICIEITDNGIGISEDALCEIRKKIGECRCGYFSKTNIGLTNVSQKLFLFFHLKQLFLISSRFCNGTKVELFFACISEYPAKIVED